MGASDYFGLKMLRALVKLTNVELQILVYVTYCYHNVALIDVKYNMD